jgi:hypothetical protein
MSNRHPKDFPFVKTATEEEALNYIRQTAITEHQRRRGPTSDPHAGGFFPSTQTIPGGVPKNESRDEDEGVFPPLAPSSFLDRLTTSSGGVLLSQRLEETRAALGRLSTASSPATSSSFSPQSEQRMTPKELEVWATTHNAVFLQSLRTSLAAHQQLAAPQTPASRPPMNAGILQPMTPNTPMTALADGSSLMLSGHRSLQSSTTSLFPSPASVPTPQSVLPFISHPFRPNNMVLERLGVLGPSPSHELSDGNYLGKRHSPSNPREITGLPDWENCCLFLTKIPVEVTLQEIFSAIKTGAVFCLHINPPGGMHTTKAAKLAFMNPEAAKAFLRLIQSPQGLIFHGARIQGRYNRNGYPRNVNIWQSRVLEILGPTSLMTLANWTSHFAKFSEFDLEAYRSISTSQSGLTIMEFRFARVDGQAQTCLQCIRSDPSLIGLVQVKYGTDPCGSSVVYSDLQLLNT